MGAYHPRLGEEPYGRVQENPNIVDPSLNRSRCGVSVGTHMPKLRIRGWVQPKVIGQTWPSRLSKRASKDLATYTPKR
jgi:hypothetical protein